MMVQGPREIPWALFFPILPERDIGVHPATLRKVGIVVVGIPLGPGDEAGVSEGQALGQDSAVTQGEGPVPFVCGIACRCGLHPRDDQELGPKAQGDGELRSSSGVAASARS